MHTKIKTVELSDFQPSMGRLVFLHDVVKVCVCGGGGTTTVDVSAGRVSCYYI